MLHGDAPWVMAMEPIVAVHAPGSHGGHCMPGMHLCLATEGGGPPTQSDQGKRRFGGWLPCSNPPEKRMVRQPANPPGRDSPSQPR